MNVLILGGREIVMNKKKNTNPKILFIGGTPRGLELIKALVRAGERIIYAAIMKEDPHEAVKVSDLIKAFCDRQGIPSKIITKIRREDVPRILRLRPDVAFVCGWRTLIPPELYKNVPLGCLAAHDSLLPKYRGFAPLNWAIINGEKETGVTLFKIDDGSVDSGKVFGQKKVAIGSDDTASSVYPRIIKASVALYRDFLAALRSGRIRWRGQDESKATYCCKRTPEDGRIDWNKPAKEIYNLIRALVPPYPCAWTLFNGGKILIEKASLPKKDMCYAGNMPGKVISVTDDGVVVLCGMGQVTIKSIITPKGEHQRAEKALSSIRITLGQ